MTEEQVEYYMKLMPSGTPISNDVWNKLASWIRKNENVAKTWKTSPLSVEEEQKIYDVFGYMSPMTFERQMDVLYSTPFEII